MVSLTVMHVLLFVLHVCLLSECDGARLTVMLLWGWMRCGCVEYIVYSHHPYDCVNNIVLTLFLKQSKFDVLICSFNLFHSHGAV